MGHKITTQGGAQRRQALIDVAFRHIAEGGFEGLRIREVAAEVGVNPATLHYYFPTKEALIQGVVEHVIARLALSLQSLTGSPVEQLRTHLTQLYQQMQDEPELFVVLTEMSLRAQRSPAIARFVLQQEQIWHEKLVTMLHDGISEGYWPEKFVPEDMASVIITLMEGASLGHTAHPQRVAQAVGQLEAWLGIKA